METSGHRHVPTTLPLEKKIIGTHRMRMWVGPVAALEVLEERKIVLLPGLENI